MGTEGPFPGIPQGRGVTLTMSGMIRACTTSPPYTPTWFIAGQLYFTLWTKLSLRIFYYSYSFFNWSFNLKEWREFSVTSSIPKVISKSCPMQKLIFCGWNVRKPCDASGCHGSKYETEALSYIAQCSFVEVDRRLTHVSCLPDDRGNTNL